MRVPSTSSTRNRMLLVLDLVSGIGGAAEQAEHESRRPCGSPRPGSFVPSSSLNSSIGKTPLTRTVWSSMPLDRVVRKVELVLDLADDLLQQVLERHDALHRTVLVEHDRHVQVLGAELGEQAAEVLRLGTK